MQIDSSLSWLTRAFVLWLLVGWISADLALAERLLQPAGGARLWLIMVPAICLAWLHWRPIIRAAIGACTLISPSRVRMPTPMAVRRW